jgi:hypothetical protein
MKDFSMTIFVVPSEVARLIHGRYVCLVNEEGKEHWIVSTSLVRLSVDLSMYDLDWPTIEGALLEKGAWRS